ncbi:hypothetical protein BDC45DRAFT_526797 [Circinella umbellata]|nr:hypothetical protein BDC45DRAFT_526797 [Circinella umbellata]
MVSRTSSNHLSIYDSLPVLDSWYPHQEEVIDQQIPTIMRSNTTSPSSTFIDKSTNERPNQEGRRSVSFSVDPPSIHYIDEDEFSDNNNHVLLARRSTYHGGARIKFLAKRLLPKQFAINKIHVIPTTPS